MPFLNSKTRFSALWLYSRYYSSENIKLNTMFVLHAIFEMFHYSSLPYYVKLEAGRKLHLMPSIKQIKVSHKLSTAVLTLQCYLHVTLPPPPSFSCQLSVLRGLHSVHWTWRCSVMMEAVSRI